MVIHAGFLPVGRYLVSGKGPASVPAAHPIPDHRNANCHGDEQPDAAPYELLRTIMPRKNHSNAHGKHEYRRAQRPGQEFQYDPEKTGRKVWKSILLKIS